MFIFKLDFDGITKIYSGIHLQQVVGTAFFLLASYQQYVAHATLANLRKGTYYLSF